MTLKCKKKKKGYAQITLHLLQRMPVEHFFHPYLNFSVITVILNKAKTIYLQMACIFLLFFIYYNVNSSFIVHLLQSQASDIKCVEKAKKKKCRFQFKMNNNELFDTSG